MAETILPRTYTPVSGARVRHRPYRGILHNPETDARLDWRETIRVLLADLPEGARVTIRVDYEEQPPVEPDDYWRLLAAHTYGPARASVQEVRRG